jgi:hypothetical protein
MLDFRENSVGVIAENGRIDPYSYSHPIPDQKIRYFDSGPTSFEQWLNHGMFVRY